MQKTENKGGFSIYAVRVSCLTVCDGEKYIIAIVPRDPAPDGARYRLSELVWVSFQTQYLPEGRYSVAQIRLEPKTREWIADRCAAIVQPISAAGRNMGKTWYSADPPQATPIGWWINRIEVEHKHKNSAFELPDTSTLYLALNMFRTTIILRGVECKAPENDTRVAAPNVDSTNRRHRAGKKNAGRLVSANIVSHLPEPDTGRF
ncbi:hypothetical protein JKY79_02305 [Candidatus Babeliales bacterium]|nr:hypothetical protein [Candidatus Babeliales bacterium]